MTRLSPRRSGRRAVCAGCCRGCSAVASPHSTVDSPPWISPPALERGEIHVWRLPLQGAAPDDIDACLNEHELVRAARFAFPRDRNRFLRARYAMRRLLAGYTGIAPRALPIAFNAHGKPMFDATLGIRFNLSHCGDRGLLAVGRDREIGVDIEEIGPR